MASPQQQQQQDDDSEWDDKSTSEIQSEDSEDLFASRPNRWRGPPQSWRTLTEEDRLTHTALERLRNQDLSVHLYSAFALRNPSAPQNAGARAQQSGVSGGEQVCLTRFFSFVFPLFLHVTGIANVSSQDEDSDIEVDEETGQPVRDRPWAPPKAWTAWPLRAGLVPPDDFMKRTEDEDEVFTYRRSEGDMPSSKLEEVVSAAILRCAKEKFRKRGFEEPRQPPAGEDANVNQEPPSSGNESPPSATDSEDGEGMDLDGASAAKSKRKQQRIPQRTFKPAVATDDDGSYALIRPSTRSILAKLDQTLTILHNARMTSAQKFLDSPRATSSEDESLYDEATPSRHRSRSRATPRRQASRPTSRARSMSTPLAEVPTTDADAAATGPAAKPQKSKRGRKPQSRPREGETEREFLIRRAKEQKKKRPVFPGDANDHDDAGGGTTTTAAAESAKSPTRRGRHRRSPAAGADGHWTRKRLERLNPRDWSDVMGAAALAGFPARVIERATQRCANLFGEGMDMHTVAETASGTGVETTRYLPGGGISSASESESEDESDGIRQARSISRMSSRAASPTSNNEGGQGPSSRERQKRSASRGSAVGHHFCPHVDCERAYRGFDRPFNLKRHLRLIHGEEEAPAEVKTAETAGGDLLGGVHRDGFLEPIRAQKGWRAEDTRKRARKRTPKKRRRDDSLEKQISGSDDGGSPASE